MSLELWIIGTLITIALGLPTAIQAITILREKRKEKKERERLEQLAEDLKRLHEGEDKDA